MHRYEITLETGLSARRCRDLGCELVDADALGPSRLRTPALDQAGLHGVLRRVRDTGVGLVSVTRIPLDQDGGSR